MAMQHNRKSVWQGERAVSSKEGKQHPPPPSQSLLLLGFSCTRVPERCTVVRRWHDCSVNKGNRIKAAGAGRSRGPQLEERHEGQRSSNSSSKRQKE